MGEEYTSKFEDESLYSKENLSKLKGDFSNLSKIEGKEKKTFKDWVRQINDRQGVFDFKIDNEEMGDDDCDQDINDVGSSRRDKVAEKRIKFFSELYKPLNNPKDFNSVKFKLQDKLNDSSSKKNWEEFSSDEKVLSYRKCLAETAEKERKYLSDFLRKTKKTSKRGGREDEEYTPNDKQSELNIFADISNKFPPNDSVSPILKKSDYITFEFLEELKDICGGNKDDLEKEMDDLMKDIESYDDYDTNYDIDDLNDFDDVYENQYDWDNEKTDTKPKYYFPELHNFLSINSEDLINITDQYKNKISELGGSDKKVEENNNNDDDEYGSESKEKLPVNDLKLQLERINVAALNFIIMFAMSDLRNTYDHFSNLDKYVPLNAVLKKEENNKEIENYPPLRACIFLSTLISKAQSQLEIHDRKMSLLESNHNVNLIHEEEKYDFISSVVDECFPKNFSSSLKLKFYEDSEKILEKISNNESEDNDLQHFLYSKSGLKFITNVNLKLNEKLDEKKNINYEKNEKLNESEKKIGKLSRKQSVKEKHRNESKNREIERIENLEYYNDHEWKKIWEQSAYYEDIFYNIIGRFNEKLDLYCEDVEETVKELNGIIGTIEKNNNKDAKKEIINKLAKLRNKIKKEIKKEKINYIKEKLNNINFEYGWDEENKENLDVFLEKEKNIKNKIKKINKEIDKKEVKDAMKSEEEIRRELKKLEWETKESKKDNNSKTVESEAQLSNEEISKSKVQNAMQFAEETTSDYNSEAQSEVQSKESDKENRVKYLNSIKKDNNEQDNSNYVKNNYDYNDYNQYSYYYYYY